LAVQTQTDDVDHATPIHGTSSTQRILSGIQPTGDKHLGNYTGGFRQYVATRRG